MQKKWSDPVPDVAGAPAGDRRGSRSRSERMLPLADIAGAVAADVAPLVGTGKVADYIPALARVPADRFGIAVRTVDGRCHVAGDADERFSIQSVSKVLTLTLALETRGDVLWKRVGKEPSGDPFNSLFQLELERGVPRNPLINAGAIVVADCLVSDREAPKADMRALAGRLAGTDIGFDEAVAASERDTGHRNAALAQLMKSFGNLENPVDAVLDAYFHQCSLSMSCRELATAFNYLADGGRQASPCGADGVPAGEAVQVVDADRARRINALMLTCGTYDRAGEFAFRAHRAGPQGRLAERAIRRCSSVARPCRAPILALGRHALRDDGMLNLFRHEP